MDSFSISPQLKFFIDASVLNYDQLAERLGVTAGTIRAWRRGSRTPCVEDLAKVCAVLGIEVAALFRPVSA